MRLVHVNPDPGIAPGKHKGAAVHVAALREAFAELGVEVLALDAPSDEEVRAGLERLRREGPLDLVYERYALARHAASEFARHHGLPHVLEVNAPLEDEEARFRGTSLGAMDRTRERAAFASAHMVACVSTRVAEYARARGAQPGRVVVLGNAVDPRRFAPRAHDDGLRARLVPAGRVALGFHGRLRPWHRFEATAAAVGELLRAGRTVQLVLLGEGEFERALAGRVPAQHVTRLAWAPHDEAARVVACFDVLPLSYAAGEDCYFSPLKLLEGMAVGAVPVVPALGDLPAVVRHEHSGLVYPAEDEAAFVRELDRLCCDPGLRARLGAGARADACRHTWADVARSVLQRGLGAGAGVAP